MQSAKPSPRKEYLQQQNLRAQSSPSLAERFPTLKSVTIDLDYYAAGGLTRNSQIKYTLHLKHAKSIFRIDCHNHECVRGDFDLTDALVRAVQARQTIVTGEIRCEGWRSQATMNVVPCGNILRFRLALGY